MPPLQLTIKMPFTDPFILFIVYSTYSAIVSYILFKYLPTPPNPILPLGKKGECCPLFLIQIKGHSQQNFLLDRNMQQPTSNPNTPSPSPHPHPDPFTKYLLGTGVEQMPFRLFRVQAPMKKGRKKSGARGPYRRYTSQEKVEIIQRMLSGESLKKIAEKTMIPKRNLIRWKHEYLHSHKYAFSGEDEESVEVECQEATLKKEVCETRQLLVSESMDSIRPHQIYI